MTMRFMVGQLEVLAAEEYDALSQQLAEVKAERDALRKEVGRLTDSLIDTIIDGAIPYPTKEGQHD